MLHVVRSIPKPKRLFLLALLWCAWCPCAPVASTAAEVRSGSFVKHEIRYEVIGAEEVSLVWGIDGWTTVPEPRRPRGTLVKNSIMYTPMDRVKGKFTSLLTLPAGATIDYAFVITKNRDGEAVEIWDTNGAPKRDYHATVVEDSSSEIRANLILDQYAALGFGRRHVLIGILAVIAAAAILAVLLRRAAPHAPRSPSRNIVCTAVSLLCLLFFVRAYITRADWMLVETSRALVPRMLFAMYFDFLYVLVVTATFLALLRWRRKLPATWVSRGYTVVALLSLVIAYVNVEVVALLGRPLNYQWFYYAGYLKSSDSMSAMSANVSWIYAFVAGALCLAMIVLARVLGRAAAIFSIPARGRTTLLAVSAIAAILYCPLAAAHIAREHRERPKLENPVASFAQSVVALPFRPPLFSMKTHTGTDDFEPLANRADGARPPSAPRDPRVKNVLLVVLESVAAEYLEAYGSPYGAMPELHAYGKSWIKFDNIYIHAPVTNKAMTSLLCSIYPWPSYRHLTQEHPAVDLPTISGELKKHGYRTSLFYSADLTFQGAETFLADRGFDVVQDYKARRCPGPAIVASTAKWPHQDMSDDMCTADALLDWVGADPATPFFAMMWTNMTHYPYFPSGDEVDFGVRDKALHRYLNALRHTDRVVGHVLQSLRDRGLTESTLVVLVGDHGEAFGRHDQMGHSSKIYEENVHVPLILVSPTLFAGETDASVGGMVDIAPTILELLGWPLPGEWQGRSLFGKNRSGRTYFFSPWSDLLFGLRDGDLKLIYNASNDGYEVYDLRTDKNEEHNVVGRFPEFKEQGLDRLASWVQFQEKYIQRAIGRGARE